jgi:hypothetical protein
VSDRDAKKPRRSASGGDAGYNSDDEGRQAVVADSHATLPEDESAFEEDLRRVGYQIKRMIGDGNCLFRAVGTVSIMAWKSSLAVSVLCRAVR